MRLAAVFLLSAALHAELDEAALERQRASKREVTQYLKTRARAISDAAIRDFQTVENWEGQRARRVEEMRDMLGLLPWPKRTPLNWKSAGVVDGGDYTVDRVSFESLPGFIVTGNLYVPKVRSGRLPAIVYVCGHAFSEHGAKTVYQRHGITYARNGYVALILDPIQIAEVYAPHHGLWNQGFYDWYSRGYTPAGVEVWNAIRAIDYLQTRPEVDGARIGMTGRSGGAAMTIFTASVDPRVRVAVAGMGTNTYAATVGPATGMHCDCMFTINGHLHDMMHQSALIAPRPLQLVHGTKDLMFPQDGYKEVEQRIGDLYRAYGHPERFVNLEVDHGHQDSDYQREQAVLWFNRYLKGDAGKVRMDYVNHPPEELSVFRGKAPADARNHLIHETFTTRPPSPRFPSQTAWTARREQLLRQIRDRVFPAFPKSPPAPSPLEPGEHTFSPEEGITVHYRLEFPKEEAPARPAVVYIASDSEDVRSIRLFLDSAQRARTRTARLIVHPRGVGEAPWEKTFWKDTLRNAMHVGHTVDSMRLYDVMRAVAALRVTPGVDPANITVVGGKVSGVLALYAAILDPAIAQVVLIDPPVTHADGPLFLNILRYTDLPEAAALLAPRRLSFYGVMPSAFDYTRHVYELYGKPEFLFRTVSLDAVLDGRYHHGFSSGY